MFDKHTVLIAEFLAPTIIALVFLFRLGMDRGFVKILLFISILYQILFVAGRPPNYNGDTARYYDYINLLAHTHGIAQGLLTKFEPLHLLLAYLFPFFRGWVIAEVIVFTIATMVLFCYSSRLETLAIIVGATLPLLSSSVRFSVGLMVLAALLAVLKSKKPRFFIKSIVAASGHMSLVIVGILDRRRATYVLFLLCTFVLLAIFNHAIWMRSGAMEIGNAKSMGLRELGILLIFGIYLLGYGSYPERLLLSDMSVTVMLGLATALLFPVLNRWLVLFTVIIAIQSETMLQKRSRSAVVEGVAACAFQVAYTLPFLIGLSRAVQGGMWT